MFGYCGHFEAGDWLYLRICIYHHIYYGGHLVSSPQLLSHYLAFSHGHEAEENKKEMERRGEEEREMVLLEGGRKTT